MIRGYHDKKEHQYESEYLVQSYVNPTLAVD